MSSRMSDHPAGEPTRVVSSRPTVVALMRPWAAREQWSDEVGHRLRAMARFTQIAPNASLEEVPEAVLAETEVLLTGWGAPRLDEAALDRLPKLKAVLHCGGTVRPIVTEALWQRGVVVSSAADLNAEPVAEFTFAAIVLAGKKAPFLAGDARRFRSDWSYRSGRGRLGNVGLRVGVVGFSRIGRRVVDRLQALHRTSCLVADPLADAHEVRAAGAELVSLDELLAHSDVLSLHAPELPSTVGMIGARELSVLPDQATVINTARGSLVDTDALTAECCSGRLNAILDVTEPEPLPDASPLYGLPNVMLTPHIAGSTGEEALRMSHAAVDELHRLIQARPLERPVDRGELETGA